MSLPSPADTPASASDPISAPVETTTLVVSGDRLVAQGIVRLVEHAGLSSRVIIAAGLTGSTIGSADLVVLHLNGQATSPGRDIADLKSRGAVVMVVVDAARIGDAMTLIGAGADALLSGNEDPDDLRSIAQVARAGHVTVSASLLPAVRPPLAEVEPPRTPELRALTPQQRVIAAMVARGMRNKVIAHRLQISEGTVKLHVSDALLRLGCRNRVELAAYVLGVVR